MYFFASSSMSRSAPSVVTSTTRPRSFPSRPRPFDGSLNAASATVSRIPSAAPETFVRLWVSGLTRGASPLPSPPVGPLQRLLLARQGVAQQGKYQRLEV